MVQKRVVQKRNDGDCSCTEWFYGQRSLGFNSLTFALRHGYDNTSDGFSRNQGDDSQQP